MISWFQHPLMFGPYNFDNVEALPADYKAEENKMSSTSTKVQPAVEGFHFRTGGFISVGVIGSLLQINGLFSTIGFELRV